MAPVYSPTPLQYLQPGRILPPPPQSNEPSLAAILASSETAIPDLENDEGALRGLLNSEIGPAPAPPNALLPPPEFEYRSFDLAVEAIQTWAQEQGYALRIRNGPVPGRGGMKTHRYICSRSGQRRPPRAKGPPQRKRGSLRCGCTMTVTLRQVLHEGYPTAHWQVVQGNNEHNHEPMAAEQMPIHRRRRRQDQRVQQVVLDSLLTGSKPSEMMVHLQTGDTSILTRRDIYNMRRKIRVEAQQRAAQEQLEVNAPSPT